MILIEVTAPRGILRTISSKLKPQPQWRFLRRPRTPCAPCAATPFRLTQIRTLASHPPKTSSASSANESLKRQAKAAAQNDKNYQIPERLLIYHAGTGRITFLAMLKLTSIILGAFFTFLVVPSYVKAEKPLKDTAAVTLCGIIPLVFIAYTTTPFVTHMHIHLPPSARASPSTLQRFVAAMPPSTRLTLTTMSFIAKPRYSAIQAGHLRPARAGTRMGLVNYVRDTAAENASRKWYMYRAVGKFYVQGREERQLERVRYQTKKSKVVVDAWIWEALRDRIAKRD